MKVLLGNKWNDFCLDTHYSWKLDVGQRPLKSLSSDCSTVRLSIRPPQNFLKIGSLVFSDVVRDDSWPWYLVTDEAILLKKILAARIWAQWAEIRVENEVFSFPWIFFFYSIIDYNWPRQKTNEKYFAKRYLTALSNRTVKKIGRGWMQEEK